MPWNAVVKPPYGSYQWLLREVGGAAGYGYDPDLWDANQTGYIESCVQRGYQNFLNAPSLPPANEKAKSPPPHRWSFLSPVATLALVVGTKSYDLPADFTGTLDKFTYQSAIDGTYPIPVVTPEHFRSVVSPISDVQVSPYSVTEPNTDVLTSAGGVTTISGYPTIATIIPKQSNADVRQQYQVQFYPTPSVAVTLEYKYEATPLDLDDNNRFPLGAQVHAETILASCLYCLESRSTGQQQQGPAWSNFMQRLVVSISHDMRILDSQTNTWPHDHAPLGLNVDFFYLQRRLGMYMGFSSNPHSFSHEQANVVKTIIESGLRLYYYPPRVPGIPGAHEWSFLKPVGELTTAANQRFYQLPEDFERFMGPIMFMEADNAFPPIRLTTESRLRALEFQVTYTVYPQYAATRPKMSDAAGPQLQELILHPTPDAAYRLGFRYAALQTMISATRPYPLGGSAHGEGVLSACLAEAELMKNGKRGSAYEKFIEQLASKIIMDLRRGGDELGYVGDGASGLEWGRGESGRWLQDVTYRGQSGN